MSVSISLDVYAVRQAIADYVEKHGQKIDADEVEFMPIKRNPSDEDELAYIFLEEKEDER